MGRFGILWTVLGAKVAKESERKGDEGNASERKRKGRPKRPGGDPSAGGADPSRGKLLGARPPRKLLFLMPILKSAVDHMLVTFRLPKAPKINPQTSQNVPDMDTAIKRKISREITEQSQKYHKTRNCQNLKNHASVWARCTLSQIIWFRK